MSTSSQSEKKPLHIVRLDGIHTPDPLFSPSFPHTYTVYPSTPFFTTTTTTTTTTTIGRSNASEQLIIDRLLDADICITTVVPLSANVIATLPNLKLVAVLGIGTNHVCLTACEERGIRVCNVPGASNESVAEHAVGLYFGVRRRVVRLHGLVTMGSDGRGKEGEGGELWMDKSSLRGDFGGCPRTARAEIAVVLGGGDLGNRVAKICGALGMEVHISERKGASEAREGRLPFKDALKMATVIFLTLPYSESTKNTLSKEDFSLMHPEAILVNVARGGIVDEPALVKAIEEEKIWGAATDVFYEEPAGMENSVLVQAAKKWEEEGSDLSGRLTLTPHLAWWAKSSIEKLRRVVGSNIEAWARGEPTNLVHSST